MGLGSFFSRIFTWWNGQTIGTQIFTWREGVKVGEDDQGNSYFRDRHDNRRWVIYNGEVEGKSVDHLFFTILIFTVFTHLYLSRHLLPVTNELSQNVYSSRTCMLLLT